MTKATYFRWGKPFWCRYLYYLAFILYVERKFSLHVDDSIRHTNHLCTSYLSSGCQGVLWMCFLRLAYLQYDYLEFSLAWNLMSINDAYCYARHLGSQSLLFPSVKMHRPQTHPPQTHPLEGTATIHSVHVKASVCMFPVQWVASSHFLESLACYLIAPAAKQGLKFYLLWPCTIHWQVLTWHYSAAIWLLYKASALFVRFSLITQFGIV